VFSGLRTAIAGGLKIHLQFDGWPRFNSIRMDIGTVDFFQVVLMTFDKQLRDNRRTRGEKGYINPQMTRYGSRSVDFTRSLPTKLMRLTVITAVGLLLLAAPPWQPRARAAVPARHRRFVDMITFGNPISEAAHHLSAWDSGVINGGLGQSARVLLPQHPYRIYGGNLKFVMRCNPDRTNYITVKYWGNDRGEHRGRLLLYCDGLQVGYRFMSDYGEISGAENAGSEGLTNSRPFPNRFFYVTEPLPRRLTRGRHHVHLEIQAIGYDWMYATNFKSYQHRLFRTSRGIYRAYISTNPYFVPPPGDAQGAAQPPPPVRPAPGPRILTEVKYHVNQYLEDILHNHSMLGPQALEMLACAYHVKWCYAWHSPLVINRFIRDVDAMADGHGNLSEANVTWRLYGPVGRAIARLYPELHQYMNESIPVKGGEMEPRRIAWAALLAHTIKYLERHERYYTNQAMIVNYNIYSANMGLENIAPKLALPESRARWFLYEAIGLVPWHGDRIDGRWQWPFGRHYYLVTTKGLSRELGYVAMYGETITHFLWQMAKATGDPVIEKQLVKMVHARGYFMEPGVDHNGYRAMRLEGVIGWRHDLYPEEVCYGDRDSGGLGMQCASLLGEKAPDLLGWAQQCLADNQYFQSLRPMLYQNDPATIKQLLRVPAQYAAVVKLPKTHILLPMTPGQPNFAWADPQDGVVVVKHNHCRLYASLYYRALDGINRLARIHYTTPTMDRLVRVYEKVKFTPSGKYFVRPDDIDQVQFHGFVPPGNKIKMAYAGQKLPIPKLPRGYIMTRGHYGPYPNGRYGPYLGRAAFYRLQFGHYLIGMNTTRRRTFVMHLPARPYRAVNLLNNTRVHAGEAIRLGPRQTVVLYSSLR
jgi:hypothetical protein